ncbi:MAG: type IV pilus assembly protein PilM [Deltaproteobacteria bacterium]|nr:type IV pilus assembly protein PilM [Deltaproteobacteria bacterium]MBN2672135.1 type IV pilus assembly protein PilM [Deltaproteobacteria bacterium]
MLFEGKHLIGVDIGTSSIKVLQVRKSGKGYHLLKHGIEKLPPQSIVDGHVMNHGAVVDSLKKLFRDLKIAQKEVALSISGNSVIIKKLNLPQMKPDELEEQIQWEAEQHIPFDISEVELDYNILASNPEAGQMDVLLVAAKKDEIQDLVEVVTEARLRPAVVDIDAFAIQNVYELNYGYSPNETLALLNVGAEVTTINIVCDGVSQFTRDISNGGNMITEEIQKQLQVSYEEAEAYKSGGDEGTNEVVPREVDEIVGSVVDSLAGEIQRSLDFYMATSSRGDVQKIFVTGGTANILQLRTSIERRSRVPVELLDPFRRVMYDERKFNPQVLKSQAPQASICLGLALRKQKERI